MVLSSSSSSKEEEEIKATSKAKATGPQRVRKKAGSKRSTGLREKGKARDHVITVVKWDITPPSAPTHRREGKGKGE